jgi:hypothetical protein
MGATHVLPPVLRTTILVCGAHFLTYALTGRGLVARARALFIRHHARLGDGDEKHSPPPSDPIDEAGWESFPASDSPAISPKRG